MSTILGVAAFGGIRTDFTGPWHGPEQVEADSSLEPRLAIAARAQSPTGCIEEVARHGRAVGLTSISSAKRVNARGFKSRITGKLLLFWRVVQLFFLPTTPRVARDVVVLYSFVGGDGVCARRRAILAEEPSSAELAPPPLSEEYLERWTPGGDTNDRDLPYPHVTADFQAEGDDDWRDDRWQRTVKGPFLSHSILLPERQVGPKTTAVEALIECAIALVGKQRQVGPKVTAVEAGAGTFLLYDLEAGSFVAGATDAELRIDPARFGMLNRPLLAGELAFFVEGERIWRKGRATRRSNVRTIDYQALSLHDDRVLLATKIDGVDVLESPLPTEGDGVVVREIELGAHDAAMWMSVAAGDGIELLADGRRAAWRDRAGQCEKRRRLRRDCRRAAGTRGFDRLAPLAGVERDVRGAIALWV